MSLTQLIRKGNGERNGGLGKQEIHDILRNERRRRVIQCLQKGMGEMSLRELAEDIASAETGESPPPRNIRKSVYNALHQVHLPKLEDQGIVDYDKNKKKVSMRRNAVREVSPYMDLVTKYGVTWSDYYRGLGTFSLVSILASELHAPVLGGVDVVLLTSLFLGLIAVSTAYQMWSRRWLYLQSLRGLLD
ncbi:MAG: winged helix-turn-helix domain-containing protein [Halobacteria archaeon]|nr:winged helix-turn-helix domain-containing protein [Halobacteria archaeon]